MIRRRSYDKRGNTAAYGLSLCIIILQRLFNYEPDSHRTTQYIGILADLRSE